MAEKSGQVDKVKKPTHRELGELYGCSAKTIQRFKKAGVDIYDKAAVEKHISEQKPDGEKIEGTGINQREIEVPGETLFDKLHNCKTQSEINFIKKLIDSEKAYFAFQVDRGEYTKNSNIKSSAVRVFSILMASLASKLESELPSKVHGLSIAEIQKVTKECKEDILRDFQKNLNEAQLT
jgi:hypothetical protein